MNNSISTNNSTNNDIKDYLSKNPYKITDQGLGFSQKHELFGYDTPDNIKKFIDLNLIDNNDIYNGFHTACLINLDNAKWLYTNYKDICDNVLKNHIMAKELAVHNTPKKDILLWLKDLNSDYVKNEVNLILLKHFYEKNLIDNLIQLFPDIYNQILFSHSNNNIYHYT